MSVAREQLRTWLRDVLEKTGDTPSSLARKAGLATTTLTRFLNSADASMLDMRSIAKVAEMAGVTPFGMPPSGSAPAATLQVSDDEASLLKPGEKAEPNIRTALDALVDKRDAVHCWTIRGSALIFAGVLPGDIAIVDLNAEARAHDVVCAQVYQWQQGRASTVFRVYEPPYLVAATYAPQLWRPLVVDHDRVVIKGVVTALLRALKGSTHT